MKKQILLLALTSMIMMSCAKEEQESIEAIQDRLLKSYITVVHKDTIQPTALGYYVIKISEGTGATPKQGDWVKWEQTQRSLDETVLGVTEKDQAIIYGLYNVYMQTMHYVPNYGWLDELYMARCLADIFPQMKEGAKYRLIVPPRLLSVAGSSSQQSGYASYILDITLCEVIESPQDYELAQVTDYRDTYYPEITDTLIYGMYYKTTFIAPDTTWTVDTAGVSVPIEKDTTSAVSGKTVYVTYVGRFLDGFVFDTNIIDSAKAHNIYDATLTYDTLSFTIGSGSSVIYGFDKIVQQLKTGDAGIGFFRSEWGYGINGNSGTATTVDEYGQTVTTSTGTTVIQSYTPLFFDVRLHKITD
ncbi:MAG: FKBP-type peptidyl-prolyl cis-trans isomerase [Prevotellaceae bacterium]|jgi:FKBP-type peptidyl-prolyl cis-trans isomerase|nr:FKBP-type peptidyl-prolyl cis-trans isomerase [Prevotellaceae bacterium]